jgi:hypothetical protein
MIYFLRLKDLWDAFCENMFFFLIWNMYSSGWHNLFWFSTIPLLVSSCYCTKYLLAQHVFIHVAKLLTMLMYI